MKCPSCPTFDLLMTERLGIEIDYCPQCRGVWLDRGELDKVIERSTREAAQTAPAPAPVAAQPMQPVQPMQQPYDNRYDHRNDNRNDNRYDNRQGQRYDQNPGYRPKKSIWQELFD